MQPTRSHPTTILLAVVFRVLLVLLAYSTATEEVNASQSAYRFGVFPYLPSTQLEDLYAPIGTDFGRILERTTQFRTSSTFATFAEKLKNQVYDIAFVQPFFYATIAADAGYRPLARVDGALSALIVVPQDSPLHSLQDLKGKTLALPPVQAAVSHLAKIALLEGGLNPERDVTLNHVPSHTACLHQLVAGTAHACVTASSPLRIFQDQKQVRFRTLVQTPTIPSSLFVVHSRVPVHHRTKLKQTILSWHQSETGRELLEQTRFNQFVATSDEEYNVVRTYWKEIARTCSQDCP